MNPHRLRKSLAIVLASLGLVAFATGTPRSAEDHPAAGAAAADSTRRAATPATRDSFPEEMQRVGSLRGSGRYATADSLAVALLARLAAAGQGDSSRTAEVLDQWVLTRILWGRFSDDTVRAGGMRSLAIRTHVFGTESLEAARSLNVLGRLASYAGRSVESDSVYRRALAIQVRALGPDDPLVGQTYANMGNLHINTGRIELARDEDLRAYEIAKHHNPPGSPALGGIENNLANAYSNLGEFGPARELYERAIESGRNESGVELSRRLYNYARLLVSVGDYDSARAVFAHALELRLKLVGPTHFTVGLTLWRMGNLESIRGNLASAEDHLNRAAEVCALGGQRKRDLGYIVGALANLALQRGDLARCEEMADSSRALLRGFFGPENIPVASAEAVAGNARLRRGDARGALQYFRNAYDIATRCCSDDITSGAALLGAAWANVALGDYGAAADAAIAAGAQGSSDFRHFGVGLGERYALRMTASARTASDLAISGAVRSVRPERTAGAFRTAAAYRAQVVNAVRVRHRMWESSADTTAQRIWHDLEAATQRLANLAFSAPDEFDAARVREARMERARLDEALARRSADYERQRGSESLSCRELAARLPHGTALVSYVRYGDCTPADDAARAAPVPPSYAWPRRVTSYAAFVLRAGDSTIAGFALGRASTTDSLVALWRASIVSPADHARTRASRRWGARLRERVWDPLADALRGSEQVFVVPDGALNLVNFVALPDSAGYLVERGPLLHYLSAERELLEPGSPQRELRPGMLAVGGVDFSASASGASPSGRPVAASYRGPHSTCAEFRSIHFEPLPGSLHEARDVRAMWEAAEGSRTTVGPRASSEMLAGAAATEGAAKQQLPRFGIVHVATHGFFLGGDCGGSGPGSRGIGGMYDPLRDSLALAEISDEPLLLAGLALAGANHRDAARRGGEDGILTAEEIAVLDLSGVGWAVLSGCSTGTGQIEEGEGVFGLRRAFRIAGARTLIMSLWPVLDDATQAWMRELYRARLASGRSTPEAVREACLTTLRERRRAGASTSPFYWGAFVAAGDWH